MRIDISGIKNNLGMVTHLSVEHQIPAFEAGGEEISLDGHLRLELTINNINGNIAVEGYIRGKINRLCGRCLKSYPHPFKADYKEIYRPGVFKDINREGLNEEVTTYEGDFIEITPEVIKSIILVLPMKPLCREDCRGLCPNCGNDLNLSECSCTVENIDSRLVILEDLIAGKEDWRKFDF